MDLPIKFNNYEDCLMGVGQLHNNTIYVYDKDKMLEKIKAQLNCQHHEAVSFFDSHINKDFGSRSPVFLSRINFIDV